MVSSLKRLPSVVCVAAIALVSLGAGTASADDEFHYGWGETRTQCIKVESTGLVYAHVTTSMWVHNRGIGSGWVTNFRLKARLIPTTSGLNISRNWRTSRFPVKSGLNQDSEYSHGMAVNTDVVKPEAEWKVQVKQIWDRKAPWKDIVREFFLTFDASHCKKGKTYTPPNQPPATPEINVPAIPGS
ncbi:MAG: hypothetical protein QOF13_1151 [Solirubrobacterales bacterium]|nr:hypothetical protein [Solirubrobacterales bacterium]